MASSMKFNIGKAITQPFRMPGGRNFLVRVVLWGSALLLLAYFFFGQKIVGAYVQMFKNLIELEKMGDEDPVAMMEAMEPMMAIMGPLFLLSLIAWAIMASIETAMHKNILRGTDLGVFPLRLGRDELRVMLAQFVVYIIFIGVYFVGYWGLLIIAGLALVAGSMGGAIGGVFAGIIGIAGVIGFICAMIYALARFAPAAALSVRDNDIKTIEGWHVSKGKVWGIIGSYLIVGIGGYIVFLILLFAAMTTIGSVGGLSELFASLEGHDNPQAVWANIGAAFETSAVMVPVVINLVVITVFTMLWYMCYWGIPNYVVQLDHEDEAELSA